MKTSIFLFAFSLISLYLFSVSISPKFASLTAKGQAISISIYPDNNEPFELISSSNIVVTPDSTVLYPSDFNLKDTKAWVAVRNINNSKTDTCYISIVPWVANLSELKILKKIDERYSVLGKTEDTLLVVYKNKLYKTGEDFNSLIYLSDFKLKTTDYYWGYLRTPVGSFIRNENDIYYSSDERQWSLDYTSKGRGVRNSFTYTFDSISQSTHIFTHDYSVTGQDTFPHSVYRKTISPIKTTQWEKVLTFFSKDQWAVDKSLFPSCRHIHTVVNDPYTGHIWIGTGDYNQHSHIFYTDDNGITWKHVGMGSQEWRVLSIWFTEKYVYWSMDTHVYPQKIFRVSRDVYNKNDYWPDMTQKLIEGTLKSNVRYMISSLTESNYYYKLGNRLGDIVQGNINAVVNDSNTFYSINDFDYDYREIVAALPNNALWAYTIAYDQRGDAITLLSSNGEGQAIDNRPRVFGIKELIDGSVDVQELLSTNTAKSVYSQFYPFEQDGQGNMYFQTLYLNTYAAQGLIQTQLNWNTKCNFKSGVLEAEETEDVDILLLTLRDCEADSVVWQMSPERKMKWSNVVDIDGKIDTLRVVRDSVKNFLYRYLSYKKNFSPVASNYVKIEKIDILSNYKNKKKVTEEFKFSLVLNENQKCLIIRSLDTIPGVLGISLYDLSGRIVFTDLHNFIDNGIYERNVNQIQNGIYVLKIYGVKNYLVTKLIF
jgi:hypothetical protein